MPTDNQDIPAELRHFDQLPRSAHVRRPTVRALWGGSDPTIDRGIKAGRIPAPIRLAPRLAAWNVGELRDALAAARTNEATLIESNPAPVPNRVKAHAVKVAAAANKPARRKPAPAAVVEA